MRRSQANSQRGESSRDSFARRSKSIGLGEGYFTNAKKEKDGFAPNTSSPLSQRGSIRAHPSSATLASEAHEAGVADWNERVVQEEPQTQTVRHPGDPPRPAKEGYEWVWYPEGFWAERPLNKGDEKSTGWFSKSSSNRRSVYESMSPGKRESVSPTSLRQNSPINKSTTTEHSRSPKARKSHGSTVLQMLSPTYPHFVSPKGKPESLYRKVRRSIGASRDAKRARNYSLIAYCES